MGQSSVTNDRQIFQGTATSVNVTVIVDIEMVGST